MKIQSKESTRELKEFLEKNGYEYSHKNLLYVGSIGVDLKQKIFYPLAVSIYPKKTDEEIKEMVKKWQNDVIIHTETLQA